LNHSFVVRNYLGRYFGRHTHISVCALLFCFINAAVAQNNTPSMNPNTILRIRATHLLGLENTKSNCNGTLAIQDGALQFQRAHKPATEVKLVSIRNVFLGGESKQVGGVPMMLGKAAAPYGGGRVLSLFTHKKYDTLTVEFVDSDGGIHGAIFQLNKGQGELVKNELMARGVPSDLGEGQPTKQAAEVRHEHE
jgi:hypothetical protein